MGVFLKMMVIGMIGVCPQVWGQEEEDKVWFRFKADPMGKSFFQGYEIEILESGATTVSRRRVQKEVREYQTELSVDEMGFVETLVRSANFFKLTEEESFTPITSHPTRVNLAVTLDGRSRSLEYLSSRRPALSPLGELMWRLVAQAEAHDVIVNGAQEMLRVSFSPTSATVKVFQPRRFREPLKEKIRKVKSGESARADLRNLAWITTPEEFAGFYASEMKRREIFFDLPDLANLEGHRKALLPFYLASLRQIEAQKRKLTDSESRAISDFSSRLGRGIYLPALPYLIQRIEGLKKRGEVSHYSLAYFGLPGARALISLLGHENRAVRETAMDVLGIALRIDPRRRGDVKISESEYDQILELVRTKALPRMKELVEIESRQQNYRAAAMALVKIEKELTEGEAKQ